MEYLLLHYDLNSDHCVLFIGCFTVYCGAYVDGTSVYMEHAEKPAS